jgi:hypothetical protein
MSDSATSPTAELLRKLLRDSGESVNAAAVGARVAQPILHRFLAGQQGLTLANADKLFAYLGLEVRPKRRPKKHESGTARES